ncbi:MAG: hypothetical protein ABL949_07335 [Fimbriimonadaceae bacterium]
MVRTEEEIQKHNALEFVTLGVWVLIAIYGFVSNGAPDTYKPTETKNIFIETPKSTFIDVDPVKFAGTSPGVRIDMIDDGALIGSAPVSKGRWEITKPLKDVKNRYITFRALDENDKVITTEGPKQYEATVIIHKAPGASQKTPPKVEKPEGNASLLPGKSTVLGRAEPGEKVKIYANKVLLATTNADQRGKWQATISFDVGPKRLSAVTQDNGKDTVEFVVR